MASVDPATFEVVWHRLLDVTEEMGIKYMRTSGSPVLVGAYDASTGITLPDGQLVAMGPYITTQAHVLPLIVQATLRMRADDPGIRPGDMFICNDPYLGATHQPDVATVAPVFHQGELRAWVGASGHWLDIGGPEPGGFNMGATTVFDEGLRMPPTRIVEGGTVREDLVDLIMNQVREPLAELDLRGQIVANQAGATRLGAIFDEFGAETVEAIMLGALDHVERRLRSRLAAVPDGSWREVQFLDHDGQRRSERKIVCTATKRGDRLTLDFTGSDAASATFANCAFGGLRAAALSGVCVGLAYDVPWNDGVSRCVDIKAPPNTIVTAEYPTPVSMSTISAVIVTLNLVMGTLSKMLLITPELAGEAMAGWCGTSIGVSLSGMNDRQTMTVLSEASHFAAGCGARTYADGVDTGGIIINTTANIPSVEQTEAEYPVLYHFRRQVPDSGGPGRFRGGMSAGVALSPYDQGGPVESSFSAVGAEVPNGYGLGGGLPGATVRYFRYESAGTVGELVAAGLPSGPADLPGTLLVRSSNQAHAPFPGDAIEYHNWQGGGGYGDPLDRTADSVAIDVANGVVSEDVATKVYGVVLRDGSLDERATEEARAKSRQQRLTRATPAAQALGDVLGPPLPVPEPDEAHRHGAAPNLSYGDLVRLDFRRDEAACSRCGRVLGTATSDFKLGTLVEETSVTASGPVRGEDYASRALLRLFYCPGCGRQLEAEVSMPGAPRSSFQLTGESRRALPSTDDAPGGDGEVDD